MYIAVTGEGNKLSKLSRLGYQPKHEAEAIEISDVVVVKTDFDDVFPFNQFKDYTDQYKNQFVEIPSMFIKLDVNDKLQIIGRSVHDSFVEGSFKTRAFRISKYQGSKKDGRVASIPNQDILTNITIGNYRELCRANGSGYQQFDWMARFIIQTLMTIEFADTNIQNIFEGPTDNDWKVGTGLTDKIDYHTGYELETKSFKWRGIENIFGNVWQMVDGIQNQHGIIKATNDPDNYSNSGEGYTEVGNFSHEPSGFISKHSKTVLDGLCLPSEFAANGKTHYADYAWMFHWDRETTYFVHGGSWDYASDAGLWHWNSDWDGTDAYSSAGGRLLQYIPIEG